VAALARAGRPALGLTGGDALAFRARKRVHNGRDLGFVGEIVAANAAALDAVWKQGALPVVASLALGLDHEYYNVNADQMAAACAVACSAEALFFLTDVPGVWDADRAVLRRLRAVEIAALAESKALAGGMLPKLEACRRALEGGVARVHILPAGEVERLLEADWTALEVGTEVVAA
jgi:acetylglutamate kinase